MTDHDRYLAIDAGGTSTRAVVVTPSGDCVGLGRAGSGNPTSAGQEAAVAAIATAARTALSGAVARSAVLAVAGHLQHESAIAAGLDGLVAGEIRFEGDLLAAYFSATASPAGFALVAGTGAAAVRVSEGRIESISDGLGWLLGDVGSGFWLGREVVRAALAPLDGRGPSTMLTDALLGELGVGVRAEGVGGRPGTLHDATSLLYAGPPLRLADHAHLAFSAAASGDPVAEAILTEAADGLRRTLAAVGAVPGLRPAPRPLVVAGSVLVRQPEFAARVAPGALVAEDGLAGAALLALRHGGVAVDDALLRRVAAGIAAARTAV